MLTPVLDSRRTAREKKVHFMALDPEPSPSLPRAIYRPDPGGRDTQEHEQGQGVHVPVPALDLRVAGGGLRVRGARAAAVCGAAPASALASESGVVWGHAGTPLIAPHCGPHYDTSTASCMICGGSGLGSSQNLGHAEPFTPAPSKNDEPVFPLRWGLKMPCLFFVARTTRPILPWVNFIASKLMLCCA